VALGGIAGGRYELILVGHNEVLIAVALLTFEQFREAALKLVLAYLERMPVILLESDQSERGRIEVMVHRAREELSAAIVEGDSIIKTEGRGFYQLWVTNVFVTSRFQMTRSHFGTLVDEIIDHPRLGGNWNADTCRRHDGGDLGRAVRELGTASG
jgi:hypothetical protein